MWDVDDADYKLYVSWSDKRWKARLFRSDFGGWPRLARVSTLEGAPSKLRLGGAFDFRPPAPGGTVLT
jgi:hypothetical protein